MGRDVAGGHRDVNHGSSFLHARPVVPDTVHAGSRRSVSGRGLPACKRLVRAIPGARDGFDRRAPGRRRHRAPNVHYPRHYVDRPYPAGCLVDVHAAPEHARRMGGDVRYDDRRRLDDRRPVPVRGVEEDQGLRAAANRYKIVLADRARQPIVIVL